MKSLIKLDVSSNDIFNIPVNIDQLQQLELLNIRNNNISLIPKSIIKIKSLTQIYLSGNNIDPKLEEALKQSGYEGLVSWLQNQF